MGAFKFLGHKGTYPWTECDEINLDWFIDNFFQLSNFVKAESEDTNAMKRWILNGGVVKDVLVNGRSVLENGVAKIDFGTIISKVKDVKKSTGESIVDEQGNAVLPYIPSTVEEFRTASGILNVEGVEF